MSRKGEINKKEKFLVKYLEPLPTESFIRNRLLKLFINTGMEDFQAQILLSIILHGGQIKPITLAKDIGCNPARLELVDGFSSLLALNLISISHTRPKTIVLALSINDIIKRIKKRSLLQHNLLDPSDALEILSQLDQYHNQKKNKQNNNIPDIAELLVYYEKLQSFSQEFNSLLALLFYSLLSLQVDLSDSIIFTKLILCGGTISKGEFFLNHLKNSNNENLLKSSRSMEEDLKKLGFKNAKLQQLVNKGNAFFKNLQTQVKFSSEQQLNSALIYLNEFLQTTSMGEKEGKRKFKKLTLIKSISQIADFYYQSILNFNNEFSSDLKILELAYSNVKLVDSDIFLSTIADPSSTRKRIETDLKHAKRIFSVLIHSHFVEDFFMKVFDSENTDSSLSLIIAEEEKDVFLTLLKAHQIGIPEKRGILAEDMVTFIPSQEIPQDILVGNTIMLFYDVGSSMIVIHEEITKNNPTEINMIANDVEIAFRVFIQLIENCVNNTTPIVSLINKEGE